MAASTLFVLRVWQQPTRRGRAVFRASVRAVDTEESRLFTRAADLTRFLVESCQSAAPAHEPTGADPPK